MSSKIDRRCAMLLVLVYTRIYIYVYIYITLETWKSIGIRLKVERREIRPLGSALRTERAPLN